jgi:histidyl-tRNA synthetase
MEPRLEQQARGTRILIGKDAAIRREILSYLIEDAESYGCQEIILPSIEPVDIYIDKAGNEILKQMYTFPDKKGRLLCLRPEATATCQLLADEVFSRDNDVKLWYETRCYRYERPQAGRYREFVQFGVEVLNPKETTYESLIELAKRMIMVGEEDGYELDKSAVRGLDYYVGDGFEISIPSLGAQKQVCGGGKYKQGFGFAIGLDRLVLAET